jgi:hypothetical protein
LVASLKRIACCHGLNGHVEKLELNDTWMILLYRDCDLMDGNLCMMNKYSEVCEAAVSSLVYTAEQTVSQCLFTR